MIYANQSAGASPASFFIADLAPRTVLVDVIGAGEVHLQRLWEDNTWRTTKDYKLVVTVEEGSRSFECLVSRGAWRVRVITGTGLTVQVNV